MIFRISLSKEVYDDFLRPVKEKIAFTDPCVQDVGSGNFEVF
jgi:hypothetical protein